MECVFIPQWRERLDSAIKNKEEFTMKTEDKKMVEQLLFFLILQLTLKFLRATLKKNFLVILAINL